MAKLLTRLATGTFTTLCSAGIIGIPATALAGFLTPASFEATISIGETISVKKTVTTDETGGIVDFFFLADNTGSMGPVIDSVKTASRSFFLLAALNSKYDAQFGVGRYFGDPSESGEDFNTAYDVLQTVTNSITDVRNAINSWVAWGGGDTPEANFYALHQAATDAANTSGLGIDPLGGSSGEVVGWRSEARKVILWFGDEPGHQDTVTLANAISALDDENVTVIGLNSQSAFSGIADSFPDASSDVRHQATAITTATTGVLVNNFASIPIGNLVGTIVYAVGKATSTIDLELMTFGDTSGLDISFVCISPEGCDDVPGGESRMFDMFITGLTEGTYEFETRVPGVIGAIENYRITVAETTVPEPSSVLGLLLVGGLSATFIRKHSS